jgi:Ni/Co efflux regulator RcnB
MISIKKFIPIMCFSFLLACFGFNAKAQTSPDNSQNKNFDQNNDQQPMEHHHHHHHRHHYDDNNQNNNYNHFQTQQ